MLSMTKQIQSSAGCKATDAKQDSDAVENPHLTTPTKK
jgi:hypothetical protein